MEMVDSAVDPGFLTPVKLTFILLLALPPKQSLRLTAFPPPTVTPHALLPTPSNPTPPGSTILSTDPTNGVLANCISNSYELTPPTLGFAMLRVEKRKGLGSDLMVSPEVRVSTRESEEL